MIDILEKALNAIGSIVVAALLIQVGINMLWKSYIPFSAKNITAISLILLAIRLVLK